MPLRMESREQRHARKDLAREGFHAREGFWGRMYGYLSPNSMPWSDARLNLRQRIGALWVYGLGLVGMLTCSAIYNTLWWTPWAKFLNCLDKSMIFAMIAGTYTPLVAITLQVNVPRARFCALARAWRSEGESMLARTLSFHHVFAYILLT